jgi:exodeoxyribonuclease V alpha subunit
MIASGLFEVYRLTENFRSEGSIIENGKRILKGKMPKKDFDFEIYRSKTESQAYNGLIALMNQYYKKEDPFYCQMIEASKKGPAGCDAINNRMHKEIHKRLSKKEEISDDLMVDDKIMFIRNEYETKYDDGESYSIPLYANGEIAIIRSLDDDEVVIYDDSEERVMKRSVLNDARLCYSYTIHKSQGSENSVVIIYLSGDDNVKVMMNRNLLYTAVTRAKSSLIILGSIESFNSSIKTLYANDRLTLLKTYKKD